MTAQGLRKFNPALQYGFRQKHQLNLTPKNIMNNSALPTPLRNFSLQNLQSRNNTVYAEINGRDFELNEMVGRLSRFNSRVSLQIRKSNTERTGYYLSMMLSWMCAIANRVFLDLHAELTTYCAIGLPADTPFAELQKEFNKRHPDAILRDSALCLAEKIQAIASALEYYRETHDKTHFSDMAKKMAQSIEALCVVAGHLDIKLNEEFERHFSNGCPGCGKIPCNCGFRADKVV